MKRPKVDPALLDMARATVARGDQSELLAWMHSHYTTVKGKHILKVAARASKALGRKYNADQIIKAFNTASMEIEPHPQTADRQRPKEDVPAVREVYGEIAA